jgi:hypothetical protein
MPKVTYFAVLPFSPEADGDFLAEAAIDVCSAAETRATAARMGVAGGAVAFSKTGDPQLGEWESLAATAMCRMISHHTHPIELAGIRTHEPQRSRSTRPSEFTLSSAGLK